MTTRKATLGELQTLILLAVLRLEDAASMRRIRREVADRAGRELSRGAKRHLVRMRAGLESILDAS